MPHIDEVRILQKRAKAFFTRALESFKSEEYDLAAFLSEQAVQLYLKSLLLEKIGDYPRTHSILTLLSIIKKIPECKNLANLLEEKRTQLGLLEDAYIASRYLVKEYAREDAEILVNIAREVLELGGLL
ncbi:MAG: HEPN domain-containing protein [Candidatus Brockarchaeota archaeon]|nr:HEPN domain-containing protein [Candidatus Brockarchaeota archaeon]